jgi:hypothetical protein
VAYVFDQFTIVKPSWVISDTWEAFWYDMRRGLSPVGTNCGALVVVSVVHAVPFFAEVRMLKSMDMGDVDTLLGFELIEVMRDKWGVADEVRELIGMGEVYLYLYTLLEFRVVWVTCLQVV